MRGALLVALLACACWSPGAEGLVGKLGILVRVRNADGSHLGTARKQVAGSALMAVRHINDRVTSLVPEAANLPGDFSIAYELEDTYSAPSTGVQHAIDFNNKNVDVVIGAARSAVSGPVSLVAQISSTPTVSYSSTAGSLSDKGTYPLFSRVIPTDRLLALAMVKICEEFGWKTVAIMNMDDVYGSGYAQDLATQAGTVGVDIAAAQSYTSGDAASIKSAVQQVQESGVRTIICITFSSDLEHIVKEAAAQGMTGAKGYAWLTADAVQDPNDVVAASAVPEMEKSLDGWMALRTEPLFGAKGVNFQAAWHAENHTAFEHEINKVISVEKGELSSDCPDLCSYIYDAVWAGAMGIVKNFVVDSLPDKTTLATSIRSLSFTSATGLVSFGEDGDRSAAGISIVLKNWVRIGPGTMEVRDLGDWNLVSGFQKKSDVSPVWPGGLSGWENTPKDPASCGSGNVFSDETLDCQPCPAGSAQQGLRCVLCEVGKIASQAGMASCAPCESGYANETGMTSCHACPRHSSRSAGSLGLDLSECGCDSGYYDRDGLGINCVSCVTGAHCDGGSSPPYPREGYWADRKCKQFGAGGDFDCPDWDTFIECPNSHHCLGGKNFSCLEGRAGTLCIDAAEGWYSYGSQIYDECGEFGAIKNLAGITMVAALWLGINRIASGNYDAADIALLYIQITGMIASFGLKWHDNLQIVNTALAVANFDVDFVTPQCLGKWTPVASFFTQLLLPFALGGFYGVYFLITEFGFKKGARNRGDLTARAREIAASYKAVVSKMLTQSLSFAIVVYHTLCLKSFQALKCDYFPDGNQYMTFAPEIRCFHGVHWAMVATVIIYIPCVVLGQASQSSA